MQFAFRQFRARRSQNSDPKTASGNFWKKLGLRKSKNPSRLPASSNITAKNPPRSSQGTLHCHLCDFRPFPPKRIRTTHFSNFAVGFSPPHLAKPSIPRTPHLGLNPKTYHSRPPRKPLDFGPDHLVHAERPIHFDFIIFEMPSINSESIYWKQKKSKLKATVLTERGSLAASSGQDQRSAKILRQKRRALPSSQLQRFQLLETLNSL